MRFWLTGLCVLGLGFPPASVAGTSVTNYSSSGEIAVVGDARANDIRIELTSNGAKWRISDQSGMVASPSNDPTCSRGRDFHTLVCMRAAKRTATVQSVFGLGGDDKITLGPRVHTTDMSGDAGNDTLIGAELADRLNGGPGKDKLTGGPGVDRLYGAGGSDRLRARDGEKDGLVECDGVGGGPEGKKDLAVVDLKDNPTNCERIRR